MESIRQFLTDDHRRLDALLERTRECRTPEELAAYDEFRRGILKHIGIEEKILLAAAARLRGAPLEQAARLRLDHGAIVSLLMPIVMFMCIYWSDYVLLSLRLAGTSRPARRSGIIDAMRTGEWRAGWERLPNNPSTGSLRRLPLRNRKAVAAFKTSSWYRAEFASRTPFFWGLVSTLDPRHPTGAP